MTVPVNALNSALQQIQSMAAQAAGAGPTQVDASGAATAGGFAAAMKASLDQVNEEQQHANREAQAFELGAPDVSLNNVMVDSQKAGIGMQFELQVRNKLVAAYTDIMQMQV